jgi:hypothetical protein
MSITPPISTEKAACSRLVNKRLIYEQRIDYRPLVNSLSTLHRHLFHTGTYLGFLIDGMR